MWHSATDNPASQSSDLVMGYKLHQSPWWIIFFLIGESISLGPIMLFGKLDTIDHGILLDCLQGLGISSSACQRAFPGCNHEMWCLKPCLFQYRVPLDFMIFPVLFNFCIKPLKKVIWQFGWWAISMQCHLDVEVSIITTPGWMGYAWTNIWRVPESRYVQSAVKNMNTCCSLRWWARIWAEPVYIILCGY